MEIKLREITEGKTRLLVPDLAVYKKPEGSPVFYNPAMATDRDISVALLGEMLKKKAKVADILSGLGARAVRYANECQLEVFANDIQPSAVKLAEKNAKLNKVKISASSKDSNLFLLEHKYDKFDCIDIDPFGSPAEFLNSAMKAIFPKNGLLCVTSTDIGVLSGSYPVACFRKYFIKSGESSFSHELGLRNLIAAVFRESSKYNFSVQPVLSYANIHYYRTFLNVIGGRKTTNRDIRNLGYVAYCRKCEYREIIDIFGQLPEKCRCGQKMAVFGPTWVAKITDKNSIEAIRGKNRIIETCYGEAGISDFYYDVHALARRGKKKVIPKIDSLINKLTDKGYRAVKTQFSGHGIKTNAEYSEVIKSL